jgi:hypothetical protein
MPARVHSDPAARGVCSPHGFRVGARSTKMGQKGHAGQCQIARAWQSAVCQSSNVIDRPGSPRVEVHQGTRDLSGASPARHYGGLALQT